jgi:hypothetical protein
MGKKCSRLDLFSEAAKIFVVLGGVNIAKQARLVMVPVPANAKPVAIGDRAAFTCLERLPNQGVFGLEQHFIEKNRRSAISKPSTHFGGR